MSSGRTPVIVSWSSGKDAAWTLHTLRQREDIEVVGLITAVHEDRERVAVHDVRGELLQLQAERAGLPLHEVLLPRPCPNAVYEARFAEVLQRLRAQGVRQVAFGDLFLEDVRAYRERILAGSGLEPLFPLWGQDTRALARAMVDGGLEARLVCVDTRRLDPGFAGRSFAEALAELPADVDPCGENGEFHTLVHAGPMFDAPLPIRVGPVEQREGFAYADVDLESP